MTVPYAFGAATSAIPLSQLDSNFNTPITLGNTAIQLGNTVTTLNNMTLANVTISSGNVTITNVTVTTANATTVNTTTLIATTANVTTGNVTNLISGNVSLTGGSITGTPISGSTGSFTTLTTSSTVTLNGGTVNGVAYLNASNVLTTGSALTFDGTNFYLTSGDAILSNAKYYDSKTSGGATVRMLGINSGNTAYVGPIDSGPGDMILNASSSSANIQFYTAGIERMRIDSATGGVGAVGIGYTSLTNVGNNGLAVLGNVGIGTSSPQSKLQVNPTGAYGIGTISNAGLHISPTNITGGFATGSVIWSNYALGGTSIQAYISAATYGANYMDFSASGTSTQMRLDSSGNLGLGVTPSTWVTVAPALDIAGGASVYGFSNGAFLSSNLYYNGGYKYKAAAGASYYQQASASHYWWISNNTPAVNGTATFTQAMTLDASGSLLVGITSPSFSSGGGINVKNASTSNVRIIGGSSTGFDLSQDTGGNTYVYNRDNGFMAFATNNTERARIDSSGNLLVGTAANAGGAAQIGVLFAGNAANGINIKDSTTTSGSEFIAFYNSSDTKIGSISRNGTTNAVLYNTTSDQRLKENIIDAPEFGGVIDLIKVRSYDWKSDHTHQRAGFIAQELITIAPEAVYQPKNPEEMMAVDYSKLVPMLIKELQSLRARVAQLESKGA